MDAVLKFRVWDIKLKKFQFFNGIFNKHPWTEHSTFPQYESYPEPHLLGEVQQFIGLLDKDGKPIYVGDIVKRTKYTKCCFKEEIIGIFEVIYRDQGFYAHNSDYTILGWAGDDTREILGNIQENPELMNNE